MSASGPVNVEIWNDTGNTLVTRRSILPTDGIQTINVPVDAETEYVATVYGGWGPFLAKFPDPRSGERIEVRVWTPGGGTVNVYQAALVRADGKGPKA